MSTHDCIPSQCPECSPDLALLGRYADPVRAAADMAWAAESYEQVAGSIDIDLQPSADTIRDWLRRGGREFVVRGLSEAVGATTARRQREDFESGLVMCPCCLGDGVVERPWPSPDRDPVACPLCDQAGRVTPDVRAEWLDWRQEGRS